MAQRMALYMQDKHPIQYEIEMVKYAEEKGFSEIWQADTRLARDCVVMMSAFLAETKRMRFGSGVLPIWTRNPAVIAATWSTMWELAGKTADGQSRVMLGLGAWWEPIAARVGVERKRPLQAMRENVEAIRQLFTMQEVTYEGEFVHLDRVKLDVAFGDLSPRDIPIYIGATGPKMLEMTGQICDGVVLNYVVSTDYIRRAVALVEKGAQSVGKTIADIDRPELLVCSLSDDDPDAAMLTVLFSTTRRSILKLLPDSSVSSVEDEVELSSAEALSLRTSRFDVVSFRSYMMSGSPIRMSVMRGSSVRKEAMSAVTSISPNFIAWSVLKPSGL